jgi:carboxypeptidase Taq
MTAYRALERRFDRIGTLREALAVLHWDHASMMPAGGAKARSAQISALEVLCHELLTDSATADLLDEAEAEGALDPWQAANLAEMRRDWTHASALPTALVEARVAAELDCEMTWREARAADDFGRVLPALQRLRDLMIEVAAAKGARLGAAPYDALLDEFEPGATAASVGALFDDLVGFLPGLIGEILEHQAARPAPLAPEGPFRQAAQEALAQELMGAVGFDFEHGRLDTSLHPFCGGTPDDVRITTRYAEEDFRRAIMGVLHESGHALYEQGLPQDWRRQPVGRARSLGMHESQSLLIEMQACRSREFMEFLAPRLRTAFGGSGPAWEAENLYRLNATAARSLIRVDADEVTYPAHVILRYRLERAMLAGDLPLDDLPGAWRQGMAELIGVEPDDDRDGCLQDIHWYCGLWGYFPTYTLGALTAAQLFEAAVREDPGIPAGIAAGDFAPLVSWLRRHVHGRASSVPTAALVQEATGGPLDVGVFRRHLERRYLG